MPTKKLVAVFAGLVVLGFVASASADDDRDKKEGVRERQGIIKALNTLSTRISTLESQVAAVKKAVDSLPTTRELSAVKEVVDSLPTKTDLQGLTPNWDKILPANDSATRDNCHSSRFTCIMPSDTFPDGAAVRDNVTGLVWQRSPSTPSTDWGSARFACAGPLGDITVTGWRLPALNEMTSVMDFSVPPPGPLLPPGHPFLNVPGGTYWTATTDGGPNAWYVFMSGPQVNMTTKVAHLHVWCVRSPAPVFAY
jgi:hypothetical protein